MRRRPFLFGIVCGGTAMTILQLSLFYRMPQFEDTEAAPPPSLLTAESRDGETPSLLTLVRRGGFRDGVPDELVDALARQSVQVIAELITQTRFIEEETELWRAVVAKLAFQDLDKAIGLTSLAPLMAALEDHLALVLAQSGDLSLIVSLIDQPISRKAIVAALGPFLEQGPESPAFAALRSLVKAKGKLNARDWLAMTETRSETQKALSVETLYALIDSELLSDDFQLGALVGSLGRAGASLEEIERLSLTIAGGNTAMAHDSIAQWASLHPRSDEEQLLLSREQVDKGIRYRAVGRYLVDGTTRPFQALEWAVSLEDPEEVALSFDEIFSRQVQGPVQHQHLLFERLEAHAQLSPDSPIVHRAADWLRRLAQSDPDAYQDVTAKIETPALARALDVEQRLPAGE